MNDEVTVLCKRRRCVALSLSFSMSRLGVTLASHADTAPADRNVTAEQLTAFSSALSLFLSLHFTCDY